jgi:methyl-accepting chemotaxis protein
MLPLKFTAHVAQRMYLWGGLLAYLALLYSASEAIHHWKLSQFSSEFSSLTSISSKLQHVDSLLHTIGEQADAEQVTADIDRLSELRTAAAQILHGAEGEIRDRTDEFRSMLPRLALQGGSSLRTRVTQVEAAKTAIADATVRALEATRVRQEGHLSSSLRNKVLLSLLMALVIGQVLILEYRWLIKPIGAMASALNVPGRSENLLRAYAMRRDEIGALGQALSQFISFTNQHQREASQRVSILSARVAQQEQSNAESMAFQQQVTSIARALESHAQRMSMASEAMDRMSGIVDSNAVQAAQSTQRASAHIGDIAASAAELSDLTADASIRTQHTSKVANAAKSVVESASADMADLTSAVTSIGEIVALIQDVASKTNLLALNATIEAARAGEQGKGFAVVAAEVKQLARRTSEATDDVKHRLTAITSASARLAERVHGLVSSMDDVDHVAATIAQLVKEQDTRTQAITANTAMTASDMRAVADQVGSVADLVDEAKRAAHDVTLMSNALTQQAQTLMSSVDSFIHSTQQAAA